MGDLIYTVASPLNGYQGSNNDVNARWTSARTLRCGIRLIPTSP